MSVKKNQFGLKRYIPEQVKKIIRKNSGYGCVVCGCAIVEYEHVDPEFKNARSHNASRMALLCPLCHGKVTKGIFSKDKIKKHMKNPWAYQNGMSYDDLELPVEKEPKIIIGNTALNSKESFLTINNKKIIYLNEPEAHGAPYRLNATFYNYDGKAVARICNNQFQNILGMTDIVCQGPKVVIKDIIYSKTLLEVTRKGNENLELNQLHINYEGVRVTVHNDGKIELDANNLSGIFDGGSIGCFGNSGTCINIR